MNSVPMRLASKRAQSDQRDGGRSRVPADGGARRPSAGA